MSEHEIAEATCTDLPQKWGKTGKALHYMFDPARVLELCHLRKRKRRTVWKETEETLPGDMLSYVKQTILEGRYGTNTFSMT